MSTIQDALATVLALRRGLGSDLRGPAAHLRRFVEFLERERATVITTELALRWATAPATATWAQRLGDVRCYAPTLPLSHPLTPSPSHVDLSGPPC